MPHILCRAHRIYMNILKAVFGFAKVRIICIIEALLYMEPTQCHYRAMFSVSMAVCLLLSVSSPTLNAALLSPHTTLTCLQYQHGSSLAIIEECSTTLFLLAFSIKCECYKPPSIDLARSLNYVNKNNKTTTTKQQLESVTFFIQVNNNKKQ